MLKFASLIVALCSLTACQQYSSHAPAQENGPANGRYPLNGEILAVDKSAKQLTIKHGDVPGLMPAMTMAYKVKSDNEFNSSIAGDSITAVVVVKDGDFWLENVKVTGHSATPPVKPSSEIHIPQPGDTVPHIELTNQSGRKIYLDRYPGQVVIVTFVYTRCPFPDFCPRVTGEFAAIHRQLQSEPALAAKTHLLSISFDPANDTPKVLRAYGYKSAATKDPALFAQWEFAAPTKKDLPELANFFGLTYYPESGLLTHSLSTTVIGSDAKVFKWYSGSAWQSEDVIKDAMALTHGT